MSENISDIIIKIKTELEVNKFNGRSKLDLLVELLRTENDLIIKTGELEGLIQEIKYLNFGKRFVSRQLERDFTSENETGS